VFGTASTPDAQSRWREVTTLAGTEAEQPVAIVGQTHLAGSQPLVGGVFHLFVATLTAG
jgi:hypothetical protein